MKIGIQNYAAKNGQFTAPARSSSDQQAFTFLCGLRKCRTVVVFNENDNSPTFPKSRPFSDRQITTTKCSLKSNVPGPTYLSVSKVCIIFKSPRPRSPFHRVSLTKKGHRVLNRHFPIVPGICRIPRHSRLHPEESSRNRSCL